MLWPGGETESERDRECDGWRRDVGEVECEGGIYVCVYREGGLVAEGNAEEGRRGRDTCSYYNGNVKIMEKSIYQPETQCKYRLFKGEKILQNTSEN